MNTKAIIQELTFKAVRSSGPGGQHVNKVASKVELYFNIEDSQAFSDTQKKALKEFFKNRINTKGELVLSTGKSRSQHKNKAEVIQRFFDLLEKALKEKAERVPTKIPKAVIRKRIESKRRQSQKKANRKKPDID